MREFRVINPVIAGTFKTTYTTSSAESAAEEFWQGITADGKYISGNLPKFLFTMIDTKTKKLHHFLVNEIAGKNYADFTIEEYDPKMTKQEEDTLIAQSEVAEKNSDKIMSNQDGGKRKRYEDDDDSSDSSNSSSDDIDDLFRSIRLKRLNRPIVYWWYYPSIYKMQNIFTPTFVAPLSPYVQLWIPR